MLKSLWNVVVFVNGVLLILTALHCLWGTPFANWFDHSLSPLAWAYRLYTVFCLYTILRWCEVLRDG